MDNVRECDYPETVEMINKLFALHLHNELPLITSRWGALAEGELFDILSTEVNKSALQEMILDGLENDTADMIARCSSRPCGDRASTAEVFGFFQQVRNDAIEWILTELIHNIGVRL